MTPQPLPIGQILLALGILGLFALLMYGLYWELGRLIATQQMEESCDDDLEEVDAGRPATLPLLPLSRRRVATLTAPASVDDPRDAA